MVDNSYNIVLGEHLRHYNITMTIFLYAAQFRSTKRRHLCTLFFAYSIQRRHSRFDSAYSFTILQLVSPFGNRSFFISFRCIFDTVTFAVRFRFYIHYFYDYTGSIPVLSQLFLIYFFSFVVTQINECDTRAEQPKIQEK
jgi:hypothetical protein